MLDYASFVTNYQSYKQDSEMVSYGINLANEILLRSKRPPVVYHNDLKSWSVAVSAMHKSSNSHIPYNVFARGIKGSPSNTHQGLLPKGIMSTLHHPNGATQDIFSFTNEKSTQDAKEKALLSKYIDLGALEQDPLFITNRVLSTASQLYSLSLWAENAQRPKALERGFASTQYSADIELLKTIADIEVFKATTSLFGQAPSDHMFKFGKTLSDYRMIQYVLTGNPQYYVSSHIDRYLENYESLEKEFSDASSDDVHEKLRDQVDQAISKTIVEFQKSDEMEEIEKARQKILAGETVIGHGPFVDRFTEACENLLPETEKVLDIESDLDQNSEKPGLWGIRRFHILQALGGFTPEQQNQHYHNVSHAIRGFARSYMPTMVGTRTSSQELAPIDDIHVDIPGLKDHLTFGFRSAAGSDFKYNDTMGRLRREEAKAAKKEASRFIPQNARKMAVKALKI